MSSSFGRPSEFVEMFGPDWPDRPKLAEATSLLEGELVPLIDELQFIVKTCTRLGWVLDLGNDVVNDLRSEYRDATDTVAPERHLIGHPGALDSEDLPLLNTLDLAVALGDRLTGGTDYNRAVDLLAAVAEQYRELEHSGAEYGTAVQDLGLERMIEDAIELAPDVLWHHGFDIVGTPIRQHRLTDGRRPDLIADLVDGTLLVIELKRFDVTPAAIEQCAGYVDYFRAADSDRTVRGLVIGDGIDAVTPLPPGTDPDMQVLPLRLLDLPTARAQRWLWWAERPTHPTAPADACVAVAADSVTPVALWPLSGVEVPVKVGSYGSWQPEAGWSVPIPLDWSRDHAEWHSDEVTTHVARLLTAEDERTDDE